MDKPFHPCDEFQPLISAQLDGELTVDEEQTLGQHLSGCPTCQRQMELLGSVDTAVASRVEVSPNFQDRLQALQSRRTRPAAVRWAPAIVAVAAGLLLAITLFYPTEPKRVETQQVINPLVALEIIDQREEEARRSLRDTLALEVRALKLELQRAELDHDTHAGLMKRVDALVAKVEQLKTSENPGQREFDL